MTTRLEFYQQTELQLIIDIANWKHSVQSIDWALARSAGAPDERLNAMRQFAQSQQIADKIYLQEIRILIAEEQSHAR